MSGVKEMFSALYQYVKEDPKDFILSLVFISVMFFMFWASLWIAAICEGRV